MATTRIKDISSTVTSLASDDYIAVDGATNGTRKMVRSSIYTDVAAAFTGAPTTYDICPLNSGTNKIDATYLPVSGDTPKGEWNANTNSPALADGSGTAGDYYDVTTAGTQDLGSGSIAYTVGDVVKYNGSTWYKIDSVANILDGSATAADGRSALSVNSKDEDAQANALKTTAPALYFNGSSSVVAVADDDKLTFSSSVEFGTTSSGTWSPDDNTPALTDGTGTLNQHYRVDSGAGTVTQGGSTLSVINGTATTAGQAVYYDGSVWRLKDVDDSPFSISAWIKSSDLTNFAIASKWGTSDAVREWLLWITASDILQFNVKDASGGNTAYIASDSALTSYEDAWIHVAVTRPKVGPNGSHAFSASEDGTVLYVNGQAISATATNSASYTGQQNTTQPLWIGRQGSTVYAKGSIRDCKIFNRELTSTEIAELARGNDFGFADEWGGATATSGTLTVGKRYRLRDWITGDDFTNVGADSNADGVEFVATGTTPTTWTNSSVVESIGSIADFRAEDYNESASKLLDRSSNNFVGVGTSVTLTGNQRHISADTIDLKNLPTSSAGLSAGEVWSNSGVLTVV